MQHNVAYYISCYILSSPALLRLNSLVGMDIETHGLYRTLVLRYAISKQIRTVRILSQNEPNIYRKRLQNDHYCVYFLIPRKYNAIIDIVSSCGVNMLPTNVLLDTVSFQTKNLDYRFGSRGSFVFIFHFQVTSVFEVRCIFF